MGGWGTSGRKREECENSKGRLFLKGTEENQVEKEGRATVREKSKKLQWAGLGSAG
jgi:hypothetical protein